MNTATTTLTLNEGYFARRNWFDWLFAVVVAVGLGYALQRYAAYMDVYEKGILLAHHPGHDLAGLVLAPAAVLMLVVAGCRCWPSVCTRGMAANWHARRPCSASSTSSPASPPSCG
jgi:hypothetical protein